jgi:hypothetical protein
MQSKGSINNNNKMPSNNTLDLVDLSRRLKQEKLFVANERKEIEGLNRKVGGI